MGRPRQFRQLVMQHTDSVAAKTSLHGVIQLVKSHCEISWPEATILGELLYQFFADQVDGRDDGQISYPARWKPGHCGRNTPPLAEPLWTRLTLFHPYDVELWREFGFKVLEQARIVRFVEEAVQQGVILSQGDISLLTAATARTVRETLKPLWQQGVWLPLKGMASEFSEGMRHTVAQTAFSRFLAGEKVEIVRRRLHLSMSAWLDIQVEASRQIRLGEGELYEVWDATPEGIRQAVWEPDEQQMLPSRAPVKDREDLHRRLTSYFGMSPAAADLLLQRTEGWFNVRTETRRGPMQVVYYAVADHEPAGKALEECDLVPVVLDYVTEADQSGFDQDAPRHLFGERLQRFTEQAYHQGGVLNQSDLAFLLGGSPNAVQTVLRNHEGMLPTRGNVVDIGPGLTHAKKVIQLLMEGYSESEIVKRTHHSYASVENYIDTFCKIVGLSDEGLTAVEIRIALGCSLKSVKDYLELKSQFDIKDYRWTMAQIRHRYGQKKTDSARRRKGE